MAEAKIDIRDLRDGKFLWIDKAALKLVSEKAGIRGVSVYSWLCFYANARGQDCYPSLKTLSSHCHVSVRTVRRTIKRLESVRAIAIFREKGKGNVYRLLDVLDSEQSMDMGVTGVTHVRRPGTPVSSLPGSPVSPKQELIEQDLINKKTAVSFSSLWISPVLPYPKPSKEQIGHLENFALSVKDEINLYWLVSDYARDRGYPPQPDIVVNLAHQFRKDKAKIKNVYGWFKKTVDVQMRLLVSDIQIKEHEKLKREPLMLGDILAGINRHKEKGGV